MNGAILLLTTGVVLRMKDATFNVTENINSSVTVCILLDSLSGNLTRDVSATLMAANSTAKGLIIVCLIIIAQY